MKITDALLGEHALFYAQFGQLEELIPRAELPELRGLASMLGAALESHANIENELLFSALEERVGEQGPIKVMRMEHDQIEGALEELPDIDDVERTRSVFLDMIRLARSHFGKEEQILFPMAESSLGADVLERLGRQWAERRRVIID